MKYVLVTIRNGGRDGNKEDIIEIPAHFPRIWGEVKRGKPHEGRWIL
jgi:hypothetical protein